ncbi:MAG TPA: isopentenyl-diphosphate Delta-isomerase [Candidatus Nanoarchaeia archaeon]|nr:isopentenyl-diphosphate Delta-isomerase [Candidatus Nanoarchaeia archaeon]
MKKSSDLLILVDKRDNILGYEIKEKCHEGPGLLHRAFSIFIFNDKDELFIQKRSKAKLLWPRYWSNTCCSHPRIGESYIQGANRRLVEECGFGTELKYLSKFHYCANYYSHGSENEICTIFSGKYNGDFQINPLEMEDFKWINLDLLHDKVKSSPEIFTPWFKLELNLLNNL